MSAEKLTFRLAVAGLNLLSVLDARKSGVTGIADNMKSLLLIGNSGPTLWQVMPANYLQRQHPVDEYTACLLYTSPSPRDRTRSRMPSSA